MVLGLCFSSCGFIIGVCFGVNQCDIIGSLHTDYGFFFLGGEGSWKRGVDIVSIGVLYYMF